jgi:formylglycine-generating enzyme required for sulfatase activity
MNPGTAQNVTVQVDYGLAPNGYSNVRLLIVTNNASANPIQGGIAVIVDNDAPPPTVTTWPTATAITYSQTLASSTLSGGAASVAGSFAFTTPGTAPAAGTASQGVTFTPADTANYNSVSGSTSVTVNKATATVALGSLSQTYDGAAKTATATTTPPGLTVNFTYNGSPSAPVNAGSYTVIGTANDPNYQGSTTSTLVIGKATATVSLGSLFHIYSGTAKTATATTTPPGLTVNFTYNGSPSAPINADIYTVIGAVNDPNYQGSANNTLVISDIPVTLTITLERGNNRITLGWPNGFKLQSSPVLPATSWQDVAGSETTNSWSVMIGASNQFYRVVTASMALIPAGAFTMGDTFGDADSSELPQHSVYVSAFSMDKTEVTKALWDEVKTWAAAHGYNFDNEGSGKAANHPVQTVSWYDVVKWCNARSQQEGRVPAYYTDAAQTMVYRTGQVGVENSWVKWNAGYRLPTEAEWEKAARGGASGHRFPWSNVDTITHSQANYLSYWASGHPYYSYDENPTEGYYPSYANDPEPHTSPVGSFAANGYGLHDMAGNVNEWCWDWHGSYSSGTQADSRGPSQGSLRVFRGGNWGGVAFGCRVAYRIKYNPDYVINGIGFRSVLPPGQ